MSSITQPLPLNIYNLLVMNILYFYVTNIISYKTKADTTQRNFTNNQYNQKNLFIKLAKNTSDFSLAMYDAQEIIFLLLVFIGIISNVVALLVVSSRLSGMTTDQAVFSSQLIVCFMNILFLLFGAAVYMRRWVVLGVILTALVYTCVLIYTLVNDRATQLGITKSQVLMSVFSGQP